MALRYVLLKTNNVEEISLVAKVALIMEATDFRKMSLLVLLEIRPTGKLLGAELADEGLFPRVNSFVSNQVRNLEVN